MCIIILFAIENRSDVLMEIPVTLETHMSNLFLSLVPFALVLQKKKYPIPTKSKHSICRYHKISKPIQPRLFSWKYIECKIGPNSINP